jgi:hypothetical protein
MKRTAFSSEPFFTGTDSTIARGFAMFNVIE